MRETKYTTEKEIELLKKEIESAKIRKVSRAGYVARTTSYVLVLVFLTYILISVIVAKQLNKTPQILGYQVYRVKTGSMIPTLNIGSIILSKVPKNPYTLKEGNIVTFVRGNAVITHRIIEVVKADTVRYRTKGDNPENSPDPELLSPDAVRAVFVLKIPFT